MTRVGCGVEKLVAVELDHNLSSVVTADHTMVSVLISGVHGHLNAANQSHFSAAFKS